MLKFEGSRARVFRESNFLVRGVGSDFRLAVSPTPLVFERGDGPYLFDVDGNRLIDYYLGMGPMILGHNPAPVVEAVKAQVAEGFLFAGQAELEYEAAHLVCEMVPCAERARFTSSGSEAVQAALRVARAATGRNRILKFEGHYHGWFDSILLSHAPPLSEAGAREHPNRVLGSAGQDPGAGESVDILPWNDLELAAERIRIGDLAAVIMEPAMCNTSVIPPLPGYLEGVRAECLRAGTVLIFDEVITGFRLGLGGAQAKFGVTPDLAVFGKAMASGFPAGCIVGRSEYMDCIGAPEGALHAGTYNGQAVVMAAVVATLAQLRDPQTFAALDRAGSVLIREIRELLESAGVSAHIQGWPGVFHVALGVEGPITDYRDARRADRDAYVRLTTALLSRGVRALERGAWFLSSVHDVGVIDETLSVFEDALDELYPQTR